MGERQFRCSFVDRRGPPKVAPDPAFPTGKDLDVTRLDGPSCTVAIPYPAEERGVWIIECSRCKYRVAVTAAGRLDDPRSIRVPCKPMLN